MQVSICSASGLVGRDGARLFASCGPPGALRRTTAQLVTDGSIKWHETLPLSAPARIILWDNTLLSPDDYAAAAEIELSSGAQSVDLRAPRGERMGKLEVKVLATAEADTGALVPKRSSEADVRALVQSLEQRPERDVKRELLAMKSKWLSSGSQEDLRVGSPKLKKDKDKKEKKDKDKKKDKKKDKSRAERKESAGSSGGIAKAASGAELPVDMSNLGLDNYPPIPQGLLLLDLSFNLFSSLSIPSLSSILTLNLNANRLTTLALPPAPLLRDLFLRSNQLSSLTLSTSPNLSVLDLGQNNFISLPDVSLLRGLTHLLLDGNDLKTLNVESLAPLSHLHTLDVSRCKLAALPPSISLLSSLRSLHAEANLFNSVPEQVASLTRLGVLRLANNSSLRFLPLQLARCTSLAMIDLRNCSLPPLVLDAAAQGAPMLCAALKARLDNALQAKSALRDLTTKSLERVKDKHRLLQPSELGHSLVVRHVSGKQCDACQKPITGLGRNAAACLECGTVSHRGCAAQVFPACEPPSNSSFNSLSFSSRSPLSLSSSVGSPSGSMLVRPVTESTPRLTKLRSDSRILQRAVETRGSDQQAGEELAERLVRLCEEGKAADLETFLAKATQQSAELPALLLRAHAAEANAPIHLLAYAGHTDALLVALKYDRTLVALRSGHGLLPLHLAAQMGRSAVLRALLSHDAEVNGRELQGGHSALHLAAERGHVDCITMLLAAGADPALGSYTGRTALDKALLKRQTEVAALLEEMCARAHLPPLRSAATDSVALLGISVDDPLTWLRSGQSVLLDAFQLIRSDFELFDANGDGCVSWIELSSAYARLAGEADIAELERVFHAADADGSASIERAEFTWLVYAWVQSAAIDNIFMMRNNGPLLRQAFKLLERAFTQADADGSGAISRDELRLFLSHLNGIYPAMSSQELAHRLKSLRISLPSDLLDFRQFVSVLEAWPLPEPVPIAVELASPGSSNATSSSHAQPKDKADYAVLDTISLAELRKALAHAVINATSCSLAAVLPPRDHRRELNKETDWAATIVAFKNRRSATAPFLRLILSPPPLAPTSAPPSSTPSSANPAPPSASPRSTGSTNSTPRSKLKLGMSLDLKAAATTESALVSALKSSTRVKEPWEIDPAALQQGKALGSGAYGSVYKGTWQGQEVAVKKLTSNDSGKAPDDMVVSAFIAEIRLMARLSHPRILRFVGACLTPPNLLCLTAFMPRGSLSDVISRDNPPWERRLHMARDGAEGLAFLHSLKPPVVHRDVKSMNLLVDSDWRVAVADFGTSEALETEANRHAARWGTLNWMPPEVFNGQIYDLPSDVFSFGMVLWECLTGAIPFGHIANPLQVLQLIEAGERPPIPPSADAKFAALIRSCWLAQPDQRPPFPALIAHLDVVAKSTTP